MALLNVIMAASNIGCIQPIMTALQHNDTITLSVLIFVSLASTVSHLFETHKHGMYGFGVSKELSYFLNRLDVIGCVMLVSRFLYISPDFRMIQFNHIVILTIAFIVNIYSEHDAHNAERKYKYMLFHCVWHFLIYKWMNVFLKTYVYYNMKNCSKYS